MLIACWSVKGGVGTTVVAAAPAVSAAHHGPVLAVDLAGDLPTCLGVADPVGPGVSEWLAAGSEVPPDALQRMQEPVAVDLSLLARGTGPQPAHRAAALVQVLAASGVTVVVDCGRVDGDHPVALTVAAEADRSLLVTRLCFVGLRRAGRVPLRPSGVVVVRDPGRALTVADAETAIGVPVVADVLVDPVVARAVDAGLLTSRLPRRFAQTFTEVAA